MRKTAWSFALCLLPLASWALDLEETEMVYAVNQVEMKGYVVYDKDLLGQRPGVLIVHEWWGHNDYARARARQLAEAGYVAFAIDMYGRGKQADHPDDAGAFAGELMKNLDKAKLRFLAAKILLERHAYTEDDHIAAIGYCFGGGIVLNMARIGIDLDAVVSFHGSLAPAQPATEVKAKVMVAHGGADAWTSPDQLTAFKREMRDRAVDFEILAYAGVKHSFTNPDADGFAERFGMPLAYDAYADKDSWAEMLRLFAEVFAD